MSEEFRFDRKDPEVFPIHLSDIFEPMTKKELTDLCRRHMMNGYSRWNKAQMLAGLSEYILRPEVMRRYFLCLSDEEILAVREAVDLGGFSERTSPEAFLYLIYGGYAGYTEDYIFGIPVEVLEVFAGLDDAAFEKQRSRVCLIGNYCHVANYLYGVTPPMQVVKLFNNHEKVKTDWSEVMDVYFHIENFRCDFIYKDVYFIDRDILPDYENMLQIQGNLPYYEPTAAELEEWFLYGYDSDADALGEIYCYMTDELWTEEALAADACLVLDNIVQKGCTIQDVLMVTGSMFGIHTKTRRQEQEFSSLLQTFLNRTRMMIYRGHTPREVMQMMGNV